jgi:hypothetical protein
VRRFQVSGEVVLNPKEGRGDELDIGRDSVPFLGFEDPPFLSTFSRERLTRDGSIADRPSGHRPTSFDDKTHIRDVQHKARLGHHIS